MNDRERQLKKVRSSLSNMKHYAVPTYNNGVRGGLECESQKAYRKRESRQTAERKELMSGYSKKPDHQMLTQRESRDYKPTKHMVQVINDRLRKLAERKPKASKKKGRKRYA